MWKSTRSGSWVGTLGIAVAAITVAGCAQNHSLLRNAAGTLAPASAGVYATAADFDQGRLASVVACESDERPIARNAFSRTPVVEMPASNGAGASIRYTKADVFGFRACDGSDVRFVGAESYRIQRAAPLVLYERERRVSVGRGGSRLVYDHFFSTSAADSVRPLTLLALKEAYPANHRFHDLLDLAFRSDDELMRYDDFHHEYRVARILRETLP